MPYWFYRYATVVFLCAGLLLGAFAYYFSVHHDYYGISYDTLWMLFIVFAGATGGIFGLSVRRLHNLSDIDPLTQLGNRRYFYRRLAEEVARMKRTNMPMVFVMIDLDDFKRINDAYGHYQGDKVLERIASIFKANSRITDTVVRWGGDEFALILPNSTAANAKILVERIRNVIETDEDLQGATISAGLAVVDPHSEIDQLLILADQCLFWAKRQKNQVVDYSDMQLALSFDTNS